ncbi:MAG: hypothetical protein CSB24_00370 [Deltaproteobacteria bacterium]|nr:MAG: hypothetical protein CSB24_00370 [Deltaproteobacteria bacterium]
MQIQDNSQESIFTEKINSNKIFPGAGRGTMLAQLSNAIRRETTFITVIGEEGNGKSFLCEVLAAKLPPNIVVVMIPSGVESFDEVVKIIMQKMDLAAPAGEPDQKDKMQIIISSLAKKKLKLLLIFDEAENLYLATIERTRKNIEKANREGGMFILMLVGRPVLFDHLQQLSMCNFESKKEKHFSLEPMTADETYKYLNFSVASPYGSSKEVFTREASDKIFELAEGNFRETDIIAEESLQSIDKDEPLLILADNVPFYEEEETVRRRLDEVWWKQKRNLAVLGGMAAAVLLMLVFWPNEEPESPARQMTAEVSKVSEADESQPEPIQATVDAKQEHNEPTQEEINQAPGQVFAEESQEEEAERIRQMVDIYLEQKKQQQNSLDFNAEAGIKPDLKPVAKENPDGRNQQTAGINSYLAPAAKGNHDGRNQQTTDTKTEVKTVHKAVKPVFLRAEHKVVKNRLVLREKSKTPKKTEIIRIKPGKTKILSIRTRYQQRLKAGRRLLHKARNSYTVQLMALTSDHAEDNMLSLLKRKEYSGIIDKLYIVQKPEGSQRLLVFYGKYQSMKAAQKALNTLPLDLRKHSPYAVPVREAAAGVR